MKYLTQIVSIVKAQSPVLYRIVQLSLLLTAICMGGLVIDDRTLMGVNVWLKPLKFAISTAIFIFTVGYFTTLYPFSQRKKKIINGINAWSLIFELMIIITQGARGVQSHYNMSNPVDGILYAAMGILVGINVLTMLLFIVETIRLKVSVPKSVQWGIFLGWVVIVVGSYIGGQMISQLSHNIGVVDGGAGIPGLNWSTKGGDLRIAHFFGIHGLQIIPLFAFWASKKWENSNIKQIILVTLFAFAYAGLIGFVFYQAKQGLPLIGA